MSQGVTLLSFPDYGCANESDVEQKFLFPLLTHPSFVGLPRKSVVTKRSLGVLPFVEKSTLPKNYVPDYIVFFSGFPACVIEAKGPDVPIEKAVSEARLYAHLLNSQFPAGTNPVGAVIGCNGRVLAVGDWDSNAIEEFPCDQLLIASTLLATLKTRIGPDILSSHAARTHRAMSRPKYTEPARFLGTQLFLERVQPNALAPYLTPLYEMFFRAEDPEKIQLILQRAYVDTAELREYDQVLHSILRQEERKHGVLSHTIETDRKREYTLSPELARYQGEIGSHGRLHLIVGARGAGKSLFIARFFTHLLPDALRENAAWCVIDFNRAQSSTDTIEDFICEKFIEDCQNLGFDPYDLEGLNRIFSVELGRLKRGALALLKDEGEQQKEISKELQRLSQNKQTFALALARHLTGDCNRPLLVAFDNVDRRESSQQLRIFQAAQWFRNETRAFALLTLRDVTFERYKSEPPLDTFAQINNFYIRPPRFSLVLQKRLKLAIDDGLKDFNEIEQRTSTGLRFRYSKENLGVFLKNVHSALFTGEQQVGRIVDALAERDVRDALGMFARIIASGHFNADRVIGIGTGGTAKIEHDLLVKILMRSDYRLYSDGSGFINNIFWAPTHGFSGNIFLLIETLGFFVQDSNSGSDRIVGYWRLEELIADLSSMGFEEDEIYEGVQKLLAWKMLAYDGEDTERPGDRDHIKITPSGFIHLRSLPHFIEYISSVALHSPIGDESVARRIGKIWSGVERYPDLNFTLKYDVCSMLLDYIVREKRRLDVQNPIFMARSREAEDVIRAISQTINNLRGLADRLRVQRNAPSTRG